MQYQNGSPHYIDRNSTEEQKVDRATFSRSHSGVDAARERDGARGRCAHEGRYIEPCT